MEVEFNGRTKLIEVPDDGERPLLEDEGDYDNLDNTTGLREMLTSARNNNDGPIDDLIPKSRPATSGGSGTIRRA
jgi:hypothetical protein